MRRHDHNGQSGIRQSLHRSREGARNGRVRRFLIQRVFDENRLLSAVPGRGIPEVGTGQNYRVVTAVSFHVCCMTPGIVEKEVGQGNGEAATQCRQGRPHSAAIGMGGAGFRGLGECAGAPTGAGLECHCGWASQGTGSGPGIKPVHRRNWARLLGEAGRPRGALSVAVATIYDVKPDSAASSREMRAAPFSRRVDACRARITRTPANWLAERFSAVAEHASHAGFFSADPDSAHDAWGGALWPAATIPSRPSDPGRDARARPSFVETLIWTIAGPATAAPMHDAVRPMGERKCH